MSDAEHDQLQALAGEYVLGTLSAQARAQVQARMDREPALRAAVRDWEERLLPLASLAEPVQPDPSLWPRIERSVAAGPHAAASVSRRGASRVRAVWDSLNFWRLFAGVGYAAAALLAAVVLQRGVPQEQTQYLVVLVAPQDRTPGWVVQAQANGTLALMPLGDTVVPPDRALQFWTKADAWQGPMSLGLVAPGQTLRVPLDRLPTLEPNQLFELTLEPAQGSPLDRPTGPIQFIGRAVRVTS